MDYRALFPLVDFEDRYTFSECLSLDDFLNEIIRIYFSDTDVRTQESCLSVFMAFRDHYPSYLVKLDPVLIAKLNTAITIANPKIIKLRRIVLAALSKVA